MKTIAISRQIFALQFYLLICLYLSDMFCIVLIGGIIGCGKTTFIEYCHEKKLFNKLFTKSNISNSHASYSSTESNSCKICKIAFDDMCSMSEQAELMKTIKGLRNFRVDLLLAAEYFISLSCGLECKMAGPLSENSQNLLHKMENLNDSYAASPNVIFFVEDNFYYRSMRYDWFQIARRANIGFCEVFLQCPLSTAIQRNSSRGYQIPEQKIRMMMLSLEFPNPEKYKWEKYSLVFDTLVDLQGSSLNEIVHIIGEAANNPAELLISEEKIEAQKVCSKNAIHQADKILRKLISSKISHLKDNSSNTDNLKALISSAIDIRQDLLNDLRQGDLQLSEDLLKNLKQSGIETVQSEYEECLSELFEKTWHEKIGNIDLIFSNLKIGDTA